MTTREIITIIVEILAGCGAFLLGFKVLSENMEKIAGKGLKVLFNKTSNKKMLNVGMGAAATAVIQSSSVTTVMVVGFVNAGIMSLYQAASVIMGANIGTTITGQIAALQAFDVDLIFMLMLFVGVFMDLFSKNERVKQAGLSFAGLGLVFVGLGLMADPMSALKESKGVVNFLSSVDNPILLLLVGVAVTAIIQSSSAVTTIVISMASAGLVIGSGGNAVLFVILGSNIGTCVTALISSIGASLNARRASIIHLLFNVIGSLIFAVILLVWTSFNDAVLVKSFAKPATQIAMFHTIFNVGSTLLFLPFTNLLVKMSMKLVREKKQTAKTSADLAYMDKRFLATPAVAVEQLRKDTFRMADMAMESVRTAFDGFIARDLSAVEKVYEQNENIARVSGKISDYLVRVSAIGSSLKEEKMINALHNNVGDIARIAELADNFTKYTKREVEENLVFSAGINEKLTEMHQTLHTQYGVVKRIALLGERGLLPEADALENRVDEMRKALVAEHIERLGQGKCRPENNTVFINLVCNLERIGDHLDFIAHSEEM